MKIRLLKVFIQPVFVIDDGVEGFLKLTEESMLEQLSDKNKESPLSDLGR
jgi:hypothetical protein